MFERLLAVEIPLEEAASFFYRLKHAEAVPVPGAPAAQQTPAMLQDPAAPGGQVPQDVLNLMAKIVQGEFRSIYAYRAYAEALKDLSHFAISEQFDDHADQETDHAEFIMRRMSVLGGPLNLPDIPAPPPSSDPHEIIQTMINIEKEGIDDWRQLHGMLEESDPTRFTVEQYMQDEQHHLDELIQMMPSVQATQPSTITVQQKLSAMKRAMHPSFITTPGVSHDPANGPMSQRSRAVFQTLQTPKPKMLPNGQPSPSAPGQQKTAMSFEHYGQGDRIVTNHRSNDPKKLAQLLNGPVQTREQMHVSVKTASMLIRKRADDIMATGAAPEAPIDPENPDMGALFQQEQQGTVQQLQNETQFFRQKSEQLTQQAQMQQQQLEQAQQQQQMSDQQIQQMQLTAQMANQAASQATMASMNAQQQALQSTQLAANMRIALQQHRQALMDLAAQDPAAGIEQQLQAANANAPPPGQAALGQAAPGAMGAQAPGQLQPAQGDPQQGQQPQQAPQGQPAAQDAPQGPAGQQPPGPQPAPGQGDKKPHGQGGTTVTIKQAAHRIKQANPYWEQVGQKLMARLPYGAAGAALGAGASMASSIGGVEPAKQRLAEAQQHHDTEGTFGTAMELAQAKARMAFRQVAVDHPTGSAISGAIGGFTTGMMVGPEIHDRVKRIGEQSTELYQNLRNIHGGSH